MLNFSKCLQGIAKNKFGTYAVVYDLNLRIGAMMSITLQKCCTRPGLDLFHNASSL